VLRYVKVMRSYMQARVLVTEATYVQLLCYYHSLRNKSLIKSKICGT